MTCLCYLLLQHAGSVAVYLEGPLAVDTVLRGPFAACKDIWSIEMSPHCAAS